MTAASSIRGSKVAAAAGSVAAVLAAGLIGGSYGPQRPRAAIWYALLRKPKVTPPGPVIGGTWLVLEGAMAFGGYRLMTAAPSGARNKALGFWFLDVAGLALFPWVFFGRRELVASTAVSGGMLAAAAACVGESRRVDPAASVALVPLVAWLAFATALNAKLSVDNG